MNPVHHFVKCSKFVVLGLILSGVFLSTFAQDSKIGFVSVDRILRESSPAKVAEARLVQEFSKREKSLKEISLKLKAMSEKLDRDVPILSNADLVKRRRELTDLDREYQQKQVEFQEDSTQRKNEAVASVLDLANRAVKEIATSGGYDIILQDSVWMNPRIDITDQVLKMLDNPMPPIKGQGKGKE